MGQLDTLDRKIRNMVHNLVGGTKIPIDYKYSSYTDGGMNLPNIRELYYTYKLHHAAHLLKTEDGRRVLMGDLALNQTRLSKFHKINIQIEEACDKAQITWNDW
jgi:hypothetical protein